MPSLLWQLHHSDDGSGISGAAQMPPTTSTSSGMKKNPSRGSEDAEIPPTTIVSRKEDLPGFQTALRGFKSSHPTFESTSRVDETRESEFPHLSSRACFDYCGFGLFTQTQRFIVGASRSGFSLAPASLSDPLLDPLHAQLRQRVLSYLNISEGSYNIIFTASKRAAFNLVAGCYDFRSRPRLVSCYDHRSESLQCIIDAAKRSGARISAARFKWPELEIFGEELAGEFRRSSSRSSRGNRNKGLFVFPTQSRITGIKYSYQWMTMAEKHRWDLLLDVSAMGPRDMGSLGLSLFRPDFIVCSFYKIFGADPSGFGCLLIKSSSLKSLALGSAEGIGSMVKAVPDPEVDFREQEEEVRDDQDSEPVIAFSGPVLDLPSLLVSDAEAAEFRETAFGSDDDDDDDEVSAESSSRGADGMTQSGSSNGECEIQEERSHDHPRSVASSSSSGSEKQLNGGYHPDSGDDSMLRRIGRDEGLIDSRQSDILRKILPIKEDEEYDPDELYEIHEPSNDLGASSSRPTNVYYDENHSANDEESWDYDDDDSEDDQRDDSQRRESQQLIVCRGLDHANSMGLNRSNCRIKSLMDWLITSLSSLYHQVPRENTSAGLNSASEVKRWKRRPLVRIFGPKTQTDRGPAVAFNLYDQRGALIQPSLVQKLADRNSIAVGCGCLSNLYLDESGGTSGSDKENAATTPSAKPGSSTSKHHRKKLLPEKCSSFGGVSSGNQGGMKRLSNLWVVTATLGLMSNFEDVYRLWSFVAEFLDPQFLVAEVLQYQSLNQETVVIGAGDEIQQVK